MKDNVKIIESNKGLGELLFGMTQDEVKSLLGEPAEKESYNGDEVEELGKVEIWHYDAHELSVGFEEAEDWKLMSISVTGSFYEMAGESLVGKSVEEVSSQLEKWGVIDYELEDHSSDDNPDHKLIVSDYLGMIFWFDEGVASEISWSPLYGDEEE